MTIGCSIQDYFNLSRSMNVKYVMVITDQIFYKIRYIELSPDFSFSIE